MLHNFRSLLLMGLIFNLNNGCQAQDNSGRIDRKPAAAGRFYPGDARELNDTLASLFSVAKPRTPGNVVGIVCPHAGYVFSGKVAASGYNQVDAEKQFDNVFIIASSHQVSFPGASIYTPGDYITPLGKVRVNTSLAKELINGNPVFCYNPDADLTEHSLEVQVPFLQYHLKKEFKLVPIVIGSQSEETCRKIAMALKPWFNDRNLFVFSTDFSHYPAYGNAQLADQATCDAILSGEPATLMKVLKEYRTKNIPNLATNLCGWTSILVMMNLAGSDKEIKITPVQYMNSGDSKYGDKEQVVGYWSLALTKQASGKISPSAFGFTREEKIQLLKIARSTVEKYIRERHIPEDDPSNYGDNLKIRAGAFVTLKEDGALRGCIGRFTADIPLYRLICQMAVASSTEDNRFEPVRAGEIDKLEIEISVLSPLKKISSASEIILGKHGIYIKKGYNSGTFLPQVATETGWNLEEFLGHCARDKAGIGWDGWKDAELFTYEACVFSEKELGENKD
jgi:AmmeMemoRadiSam system protein B/AmmeMemoRadiSam system protein A